MSVAARSVLALLMMLSLSHCAQVNTPQGEPGAELPAAGEPQQATEPSQPEKAQPEQVQPEQSQTSQPAGATDSKTAVTEPGSAPQSMLKPVPKPELSAEYQQAFARAKQQLRAEDYQGAAALLAPMAEVLPDAGGIHYNLALCYWNLQQTEQSTLQLTQLLARQPGYVEAANLLGVIARQQGNFNQARRYWLDALAQQNDFASAHKNLGFLYELYLGQPAQARYHYQQYQELTADPMAEAWLTLLEQQE
ncbi:tetratricopeptide repeat protein [Arsukibacterium sp.]|uniref:tetratricopeptide repeat protein n=1 Tax=Arsukibacterium sp. TaxID=1977258 RepID=UPI003568E734